MLLLLEMMMMMMMASASAYENVSWAYTNTTPSLPLHVIFERGAPVMLEGDPVQMSCPSNPSSLSNPLDRSIRYKSPYTWYYLNRSSGVVSRISNWQQTLLLKKATMGDSGQYNCTALGERLSTPLVEASSQGSIVLEGSGLVTLKCVTTSGPSLISWSWYRLGGAELQMVGAWLQRVGAEEELTLGRAGDSGEYQCRAYTDTQGLTQENTSLAHRVNIIPLPVGVLLGTAGFVLAFLCLCLLLLLAVWLFMQTPIKTTALDKLANGSPTKGELRTDTGLTP
ncbi:hypothetical protein SKAU_G00420430 [Synaphobranchus kaupii]|uniref:Ig-like domain-containing protein n=1 Tax=Synaphobranchus kaupii TaxID=118154 RepID=A0A9Q1E6J5_SYNKA|nr:hypothetical protein SKAU_G00420430 [Synaphobranchus kaupii]